LKRELGRLEFKPSSIKNLGDAFGRGLVLLKIYEASNGQTKTPMHIKPSSRTTGFLDSGVLNSQKQN